MNRAFVTMIANVGNNVRDTSTTMATQIERFINDSYKDVMRRINWTAYNEDYSFTASSKDNVLPDDFNKPLKVWDNTNKIELVETSIPEEVKDGLSLIDQSGTSERYAILDRPVQSHPTSSSTLSIVSSSASDTTQAVHVKGISSGVVLTESVTLTGTTPAVTTNEFTRIVSITKSATTTGKITITSNSGAVTVAVLGPSVIDYRVKIMRLYASPASSIVIFCPYILKPVPLVNNYDVPLIDAADVIENGATAKAWRYKRQFAKAKDFDLEYEKGIVQLIWDKENSPNKIHMFGTTPYSRETC